MSRLISRISTLSSGSEICAISKAGTMIKVTRITDLQDQGLWPYTIKNERQLLRCFEPKPGLFIAESPKVISRALDAGYEPLSLLIEATGLTAELDSDDCANYCTTGSDSGGNGDAAISDMSASAGHATVSAGETESLLQRLDASGRNVPVYAAPPEVLRQLTGFQLTRGALCAMRRKPLPSVQELLGGQKVPDTPFVEFSCDAKTSGSSATPSESVPESKDAASSDSKPISFESDFFSKDLTDPDSRTVHPASSPEIIKGIPYQENISRIAILENVVNPTNVGAIFRSAAAMGMDAVLLTEGCSNPLYRRAARVSMGTVFQIPWTYIPDWPHPAIERLRELGFQTASMALSHDTVSIDDPALRKAEKLAVILGTEGDGLSQTTINASDYTIRIPMTPGIDSLNVAAASAVAFWELGNLKRQK